MAAVAMMFVLAGVSVVATVLTNYLYRYSQHDGLIGQVDDRTYASLTEMYPPERALFWGGIAAVVLGIALVVFVAVVKRRSEIGDYVDSVGTSGASR
jgi:hypothetical protein